MSVRIPCYRHWIIHTYYVPSTYIQLFYLTNSWRSNPWFRVGVSDSELTIFFCPFVRALHAMDPNLPMGLMSSPHIFSGFCCAILLIPLALYGFFRESQFPLVNGSKLFEFGKHQSRKRFSEDAAGLIQSGLRKVWLKFFKICLH